MTSTTISMGTSPATVQVHALSAGHFSLPEEQFVHPSSPAERSTVPSLCFLVQHVNPTTGSTTRIVFDLGLRRNLDRYSEPIQHHANTRQPISTDPDVVKSLNAGALTPEDIDYVIYSHVSSKHAPTTFCMLLMMSRFTGITSVSREISLGASSW